MKGYYNLFNIHKYQSFLYFLGVYFSLFFCLAISIPIFMADNMESIASGVAVDMPVSL